MGDLTSRQNIQNPKNAKIIFFSRSYSSLKWSSCEAQFPHYDSDPVDRLLKIPEINAMGPRRSAVFHQPLQRFREISQICRFLQLWHEPHCPYSELPIKCPRNDFKLPGESMSSAEIVDEFAISHQTWAFEFLEGWQVRPLKSSVWSLPVLVVQTYQLHDVRRLNPELNFWTVALEKVGNA